MKKQENSIKATIVLNKEDSFGFLDLSSPNEFFEVMKVLNEMANNK